ncbi:MAG: alpha-L-fucosidase, partial [Asticcacaulis sp.]|nr:alpha-L-fucosidase [Asticcacaulis sp.]
VMTSDEVVRLLVDAVVRNGNVIANVGPDRDGVIPPKQAETLRGVGRWLQRHGKAVYSTRPGPLQPVEGVYGTTQAGQSVFVHIVAWPQDELSLPLSGPIANVKNLSGDGVKWTPGADGLTVSVPPPARGTVVTVLEVKLRSAA